ncbi:MAG TPA: betaine/proline/choline family ABC transporter ATP-binding protein [Acidimicrobiales bacterium]|nr:betaine/proline/choline family ABC transporter ATP-binding protein [Acidimicrobiales bacterium]
MIRLERVTKRYANGTVAVHELDLDVGDGETCVLVGPSGCGKTTTMKMINRLVEPTGGRILLDGDDVTRIDAVDLRRRIGYVIQQIGLFPHQTVADNVATVPRLLGWDKRRTRTRVGELLDLVGLDAATFAGRYPSQLSGGQRQRVGVARALAADPPVLLMDEPFGAIDPITRDRLQNEFLRLQAEVKKTVVFVTHDVDEAVKLGDRIAVMREGGYLEQYAPPADILGSPATDFVADFVGADRGLKRLTVTRIDTSLLEQPPSIAPGASPDDVVRAGASSGSRWAVVVDASGVLRGYVDVERPSVVKRLPAWVDVHSTLKDALGQMLLSDAAWVAVLDGERYLGVLTPDTLVDAFRQSVVTAVDR